MGKIFAGLLFLFLHFKVNGFDLLPDFAGYLLIWWGMRSVPESEILKNSQSPLAACIVAGAVLLLRLAGGGVPGIILSFGVMICQLTVTYTVVRGVEEVEKAANADLRAGELRKSWYFTVICSAAAYLCSLIESIAAVAPMVLAFMGVICYLVYVFKAWKAYEGWREEQTPAV